MTNLKLNPGSSYPLYTDDRSRIFLRDWEKKLLTEEISALILEEKNNLFLVICPTKLVNLIRTKSFFERPVVVIGSEKELKEKGLSIIEEKLINAKGNFVKM